MSGYVKGSLTTEKLREVAWAQVPESCEELRDYVKILEDTVLANIESIRVLDNALKATK